MKTMTIRNIPDDVAAYISDRASEEGRSVNMMTVAILTQASGRNPWTGRRAFPRNAGIGKKPRDAHRDNGLGRFCGMLPGKTADALLKFVTEADFSKVDPEDR